MSQKRFIFIEGHFKFFYLTDSQLPDILEELAKKDSYHEVDENIYHVGSLEKLQEICDSTSPVDEEEVLVATFFEGHYIVLEENEDKVFNRLENMDKVFSCHQVTPYVYKIFEL